jgi:hypothetical protein
MLQMRVRAASLPWAAIGHFAAGSIALLLLISAMRDPTTCSEFRGCGRLHFVYMTYGKWGVRVVLLVACAVCFYKSIFVNRSSREL